MSRGDEIPEWKEKRDETEKLGVIKSAVLGNVGEEIRDGNGRLNRHQKRKRRRLSGRLGISSTKCVCVFVPMKC